MGEYRGNVVRDRNVRCRAGTGVADRDLEVEDIAGGGDARGSEGAGARGDELDGVQDRAADDDRGGRVVRTVIGRVDETCVVHGSTARQGRTADDMDRSADRGVAGD